MLLRNVLPLQKVMGRLRTFQQVPLQKIHTSTRMDGESFEIVLIELPTFFIGIILFIIYRWTKQ